MACMISMALIGASIMSSRSYQRRSCVDCCNVQAGGVMHAVISGGHACRCIMGSELNSSTSLSFSLALSDLLPGLHEGEAEPLSL